jgi:hypothetical protein
MPARKQQWAAQQIETRGAISDLARKVARFRASVLDHPSLHGWLTTDEEEISAARWRGRTRISAGEPFRHVPCAFQLRQRLHGGRPLRQLCFATTRRT